MIRAKGMGGPRVMNATPGDTMDRDQSRAPLSRRNAVAGITLAGIGALLAACQSHSSSTDLKSVTNSLPSPSTPTSSLRDVISGTPSDGVTNSIAPHPTSLNDRQRYGHLMRRAGFGASRAELDRLMSLGWSGAVNSLVDYESISNESVDRYLTTLNLDLTKAADIQR